VLSAAGDLLRESGYEAMTMVGVAERAGVGKQTIYRWWSSKADLVAECVLEGAFSLGPFGVEQTGDPVADLRAWFDRSLHAVGSDVDAPLFRALAQGATATATTSDGINAQLTRPLHSRLTALLQQGIDDGALKPGVPLDAVAHLLVSALLYALVARDERIFEERTEILDVVLHGILLDPDPQTHQHTEGDPS